MIGQRSDATRDMLPLFEPERFLYDQIIESIW